MQNLHITFFINLIVFQYIYRALANIKPHYKPIKDNSHLSKHSAKRNMKAFIINKKGNNMYFLNIKQLKEDIIDGTFSEKDRFTYIFIYILLITIVLSLPTSYEETIHDYIDSAITFLITMGGTYYFYKANGGSEGQDFAGRYFSITWVIGIRIILMFIPIMILLVILPEYIELSTLTYNLILSFIIITLDFLIYFLSYKHMIDVKQRESNEG